MTWLTRLADELLGASLWSLRASSALAGTLSRRISPVRQLLTIEDGLEDPDA